MNQLDITYHNTYNCKTLKIEDNSTYDIYDVKNIILEVKAPGQTSYTAFYLNSKDWKSIVLNCNTLEICCVNRAEDLTNIPDGIYEIKYSIDPNTTSMVEFSHMRVCQIMSSYIKLLGLFLSNRSDITKINIDLIEKEFIEIKDTIDASVFAVEECLDNILGLELYSEAAKRINKLNDGNFTSCCK